MKEFKEFISRGNVVDLAVAVVVGAAFTAIVTAVVEGLFTPLVGMIGGTDFRRMTFTINDSMFSYGTVINAIIYFLAVAAVVFFGVVKPLNVLQQRLRHGEQPIDEVQVSDEAALLVEIRNLLAAQAAQAVQAAQAAQAGASGRPANPSPPRPPAGTAAGGGA